MLFKNRTVIVINTLLYLTTQYTAPDLTTQHTLWVLATVFVTSHIISNGSCNWSKRKPATRASPEVSEELYVKLHVAGVAANKGNQLKATKRGYYSVHIRHRLYIN